MMGSCLPFSDPLAVVGKTRRRCFVLTGVIVCKHLRFYAGFSALRSQSPTVGHF